MFVISCCLFAVSTSFVAAKRKNTLVQPICSLKSYFLFVMILETVAASFVVYFHRIFIHLQPPAVRQTEF